MVSGNRQNLGRPAFGIKIGPDESEKFVQRLQCSSRSEYELLSKKFLARTVFKVLKCDLDSFVSACPNSQTLPFRFLLRSSQFESLLRSSKLRREFPLTKSRKLASTGRFWMKSFDRRQKANTTIRKKRTVIKRRAGRHCKTKTSFGSKAK